MADNSLPDEIISEILSPALKVSDDVFSDTSEVSPFAEYSESSSAYLLVCKAWLRVATPLLYNVVILRSKAQAHALGRALSKNADLGRFIKKLRVEGGYGPSMGIILKCSPNISDLFLSFEIWAADSTVGLCKGLPLINPTRVIVRDSAYKRLKNKMVSNLESALTESISKWDHLSIFDLSYFGGYSDRAVNIVQALAKSRRLQTVVIQAPNSASWIYQELKECPLQVIQIKMPLSKWYLEELQRDSTPAVKALLRFTEISLNVKPQDSGRPGASDLPPSLNPSFTPMNTVSKEVKESIWKRILYFAMSVPQLEQNFEQEIPPRLPLLLVSKTFNRLALPYLYTHIIVEDSAASSKFLTVLKRNPALASQVRSIYGSPDGLYDSRWAKYDPYPEALVALLSQTTGLLKSETDIPWDAFEAMSICSGSTLREFSRRVRERQRVSTTVFDNLTGLRTLDWKCSTNFDCNLDDAPSDGLLNLEEIRIWYLDPSFLTALSRMKLPSLRCARLSEDVRHPKTFLKTHGNKLIELEVRYVTKDQSEFKLFEVCPNLSVLLLNDPPHPDHFRSPQTAPFLEKITFGLRYWYRSKEQLEQWDTFFSAFDPKCFPRLREIEVKCCEWPTNEREIGKSCWVRWAEHLLKDNINLTDKHGKKWRPRLKVREGYVSGAFVESAEAYESFTGLKFGSTVKYLTKRRPAPKLKQIDQHPEIGPHRSIQDIRPYIRSSPRN
ncbi:hypothetical protein C8R44DRAFT_737946 [Mycena epipterygia]|nr:hypothetical protein C8R44DRAFT_737946 [Mycena epipterygia]